eukprot:SAG31_NODE_689_length_12806_cov_5.358857_9_plen_57_part_00
MVLNLVLRSTKFKFSTGSRPPTKFSYELVVLVRDGNLFFYIIAELVPGAHTKVLKM